MWITTNCGKFFKLGFSNTWSKNFQMYKLGFKEAKVSKIKLQTFFRSWRKQESSRKTSTSASLTMLKPLTMWITTNRGRFFKRWAYQTTLPVSLETGIWVKKQQLEMDLKQLTGLKLGKAYDKAVYCYCAYLTSMQRTSWEMLDWMKHKLESRFLGEVSITSDTQMTHP